MFLINEVIGSVIRTKNKFDVFVENNSDNKINRYIIENYSKDKNIGYDRSLSQSVNSYFNSFCKNHSHIIFDGYASLADEKIITYIIETNYKDIKTKTTYAFPLEQPAIILISTPKFRNIYSVDYYKKTFNIVNYDNDEIIVENVEGLSTFEPELWNDDDKILLRMMGEFEG